MKLRWKKGPGWARLKLMFNIGHSARIMEAHMDRATQFNGSVMVAAIRDTIKKGGFEANKPLTTFLKKSELPLVESGNLWGAIAASRIKANKVFVGVLRSAKEYDVAVTVHEGKRIPVTPAMRGLFFYLWKASMGEIPTSKLSKRGQELFAKQGTGWRPLSPKTKAIIIPKRPFITKTFENASIKALMRRNWKQAAAAALREIAK